MGNLVRGSEKVLVNTVDQTVFGAYVRSSDSVRMLVHKPTGIHIPATNTTIEVSAGYGRAEVLETMLLDLFAPYPCETCNYGVVMNMEAIPFKNGRLTTHREVYRPYSALIESLGVASGSEINDADKLSIYSQLVPTINADKHRLVDAGMVWVVTDEDSDDDTVIKITMQNGDEYTITAGGSTSLATVINAHATLSLYMKAYTPSVTNSSDDYTCIIESIAPVYFEVTEVTDANVEAFYIKLEQKETDCRLVITGGSANSKWEKVTFNKVDLGKGTITNAATTDADVDIVVDDTTIAITPTGGSLAAKLLNAAEEMSLVSTVSTLSNFYMAALDDADGCTLVAIGREISSVKNHEVTDLWSIEIEDMGYQQPTKGWKDMADIFPNGYGSEYTNKERVDADSRYFMVRFQWKTTEYGVSAMNEMLYKEHIVEFYIKESQMPATITAATGEYWDGTLTNMMSDTLPSIPTYNIVELINWAGNWNGTSTGITNAMLAE